MIKFIHTADIHFGMENYGRIDPKTGIHSRLLDFNRALNFCIDRGIEEKIDFFLFAGDAYKTTNPSPTQQKLFMECFFRLHKAGIPIVIVVGNHDNPMSFGKATSLDIFGDVPLDGFHVISKPTTLQLTTKNGPINIVGIPWPNRNNIALKGAYAYKSAEELTRYLSDAVGAIVEKKAAELDPAIPAVLSGHLTVSSGVFSGSEKRAIYGTDPVLLPSQLAIAPFDYVGLGHLHRYQDLNKSGYPSVVYSGSIERVDFGERKEDKGFCLVSIPEKGKATHKFIKTPQRPFIQVDVRLNDTKDQTEQILTAIKQHDLTDSVLKIVYHVPVDQQDTVDLRAIQRACSAAWYLVNIVPVHPPVSRERRGNVSVDMSLETLLDAYFSGKEDLASQKSNLIRKTLELVQETEEQEIEDE